MPLLVPGYIQQAGVIDEPLDYVWDESVKEEILLDQPRLMDRLSEITDRGGLAFCLASAEWILWKLSKKLPDSTPFQLLEAAWAGTIDWLYLKSFNPPEWLDDLPDPIAGTLDQALWLLKEALVAAREGEPPYDRASALSELAIRILKKPDSYKSWRRFVLRRLAQLYPAREDQQLGEPVPREALDREFDFKPELARALLARFLASLDPARNPYLRSAKEMKAAGFKGTPYST